MLLDNVLCRFTLCCASLHCIVPLYIVFCSFAWHCADLHCNVRCFTLYCASLHCIVPLYIGLCRFTLYCAPLPVYIVMCHFTLCCATLHCIVPLYIVLCCFETASHCSLENGPHLMFDIALWNLETASLCIWKKESLLTLSAISRKIHVYSKEARCTWVVN